MVEMTDFLARGLWAVPKSGRELKKGGEGEARRSASGFPISRDTCSSLPSKLAGLCKDPVYSALQIQGRKRRAKRV